MFASTIIKVITNQRNKTHYMPYYSIQIFVIIGTRLYNRAKLGLNKRTFISATMTLGFNSESVRNSTVEISRIDGTCHDA